MKVLWIFQFWSRGFLKLATTIDGITSPWSQLVRYTRSVDPSPPQVSRPAADRPHNPYSEQVIMLR